MYDFDGEKDGEVEGIEVCDGEVVDGSEEGDDVGLVGEVDGRSDGRLEGSCVGDVGASDRVGPGDGRCEGNPVG